MECTLLHMGQICRACAREVAVGRGSGSTASGYAVGAWTRYKGRHAMNHLHGDVVTKHDIPLLLQ